MRTVEEIKENFKKHAEYLWIESQNSLPISGPDLFKLWCIMVDIDPDFYIDKVMSGPAGMCLTPNIESSNSEDFERFAAVCSTMNYKNQISGELDLNNEQDLTYLAHCLQSELRSQFRIHKLRFTYIPAIPYRAIDPGQFLPIIRFKYRAARAYTTKTTCDGKRKSVTLLDHETARVYRYPEDLEMEARQIKKEWLEAGKP